MLVLSRKCGEQILVPEFGIVFTILETQGRTVRVGISAPDRVCVYREEVWKEMHSNRGVNRTEPLAHADHNASKKGIRAHGRCRVGAQLVGNRRS
jgi:carbon storage regulator CsrA